MKRSELKQIIREEIKSMLLKKTTLTEGLKEDMVAQRKLFRDYEESRTHKRFPIKEGDVSRWALEYKNIYALKISFEDVNELEKIVNNANKKYKDSGTSVLGGGLYGDGKLLIKPWSQGNMGPETAYSEAKKFLEKKYPKIRFDIKYGRMD